jgi:NIPSNAP
MQLNHRMTQLALLTMTLGVLATGVTTRLHRPIAIAADSNRVFELRIYHAVPGKLQVMESRFRDQTSKILTRHNLNVVSYWTTEDVQSNSFVFLLAHESRDQANKNWAAFRSDPEFQKVIESEKTEKTLEKADIIWLRPTDFSPME